MNTGFHTVVAHASQGPPVDVLLNCPSLTSNGTLRINNTNDFGDSQDVWVDNGSANPTFDILGQNQRINKTVQFGGDHFALAVASVFNANRMATIELLRRSLIPASVVPRRTSSTPSHHNAPCIEGRPGL